MKTIIDSFDKEYSFLSNFFPCIIKFDGNDYPSVELVGIRILVRPAASEDVSESHGDHNGSDYYGPYDLG